MIWKVFLYALVAYLLVCALVFLFQRSLLYLPAKARLPEAGAAAAGMRSWPSPEDFRGFTGQEPPVAAEGTVIVFHGNAGAAYHRGYTLEALSRQNLRVILAEYPGYGGRAGRPSETVLVEDALETIRLAHQAYGEPLYLWGESLGAGVVSAALRRTDVPVKGAVLFTPWDTLPRLAQTHYWYLPARWLVLDRYDNLENLQGYEGNLAFILAGRDEVAPVKHGKRLYDSIPANKKLWLFEDATHNTVPVEGGLPWWGEVAAFLAQETTENNSG